MTTLPPPGPPEQSPRGHRGVPHTADLCVRAWAESREECLAEAVRGLVSGFAQVPSRTHTTIRECVVTAPDDERLLVAVLEEAIYLLDVHQELAVDAAVRPTEGGAAVQFAVVDAASARQIGAVPKAVALHGLRVDHRDGGWSCQVTLDV